MKPSVLLGVGILTMHRAYYKQVGRNSFPHRSVSVISRPIYRLISINDRNRIPFTDSSRPPMGYRDEAVNSAKILASTSTTVGY